MTLFRKQFRIESARRSGWDYSQRGWYFVTICTKDKKCSLGSVAEGQMVLCDAGAIAEIEMRRVADHYLNVTIDRFVVMPNHVHAIIVIEGEHAYSPLAAAIAGRGGGRASSAATESAGSLSKLIVETRLAASPLAAQANKANSLADIVGGYKAGVSKKCRREGIADFAWQTRFHDHILRSNASVNAARDYIDRNPENWLEDPDRSDTGTQRVRKGSHP